MNKKFAVYHKVTDNENYNLGNFVQILWIKMLCKSY